MRKPNKTTGPDLSSFYINHDDDVAALHHTVPGDSEIGHRVRYIREGDSLETLVQAANGHVCGRRERD